MPGRTASASGAPPHRPGPPAAPSCRVARLPRGPYGSGEQGGTTGSQLPALAGSQDVALIADQRVRAYIAGVGRGLLGAATTPGGTRAPGPVNPPPLIHVLAQIGRFWYLPVRPGGSLSIRGSEAWAPTAHHVRRWPPGPPTSGCRESGETGRRAGFRIQSRQRVGGSTPPSRTSRQRAGAGPVIGGSAAGEHADDRCR